MRSKSDFALRLPLMEGVLSWGGLLAHAVHTLGAKQGVAVGFGDLFQHYAESQSDWAQLARELDNVRHVSPHTRIRDIMFKLGHRCAHWVQDVQDADPVWVQLGTFPHQ